MRRILFAVLLALGLVGANEAYTVEPPDYSGKKLEKHDFRGQDLSGASFDNAELYGSDFTGANLENASFVGADLSQVTLDQANCASADFTDAKFRSTMARETNFARAKLAGSNLGNYSSFRGSSFRGADLKHARGITEVTSCDFSEADVRGANLKDGEDWKTPSTKWTKAKYDDATRFPKGVDPETAGAVRSAGDEPKTAEPRLDEPRPEAEPRPEGGKRRTPVKADGVIRTTPPKTAPKPEKPPERKRRPVGTGRDEKGQDWRNRDLRDEVLDDVDLSGANLTGAQLQNASLKYADLRGADLSGARLDGADLTGCDLREADLEGAHFTDTRLDDANLDGQDLHVLWGLQDCSFRGAELTNLKGGLHITVTRCDFRNADLRGAALAGPGASYYQSCEFRGAVYDRKTRWPKGFDLQGVGAVNADEGKPDRIADGEDGDEPPRLFAPDRDPNAPSEAEVKKSYSENYRVLWRAVVFGLQNESRTIAFIDSTARFSFQFKKLTYLKPEPVHLAPGTGLTVRAYPVRIECVVTCEGRDGSESTHAADWIVRFHKTDDGVWKAIHPEGKGATKNEEK